MSAVKFKQTLDDLVRKSVKLIYPLNVVKTLREALKLPVVFFSAQIVGIAVLLCGLNFVLILFSSTISSNWVFGVCAGIVETTILYFGFQIFFRKAYRYSAIEFQRQMKEKDYLLEQLNDATQRYRSIFENAIEGIYQATPDGKFIVANPAFARMMGYSSSKDIIESVTDVSTQIYVNAEDRIRFRSLMDINGEARMEYLARKKNNEVVWLSVSARAVKDKSGRLLYYESIAEDVTERRNTLKELEASREKLLRSNEELEHFVYISSHDLKEPLRMITLYIDLLKRQLGGQFDQRTERYFNYIVESASRAKSLINDLLLYSDIKNKNLTLSKVNMQLVMEKAVDTLKDRLDKVRGIVVFSDLPIVYCDETQLYEAVYQLLDNAIKFRRTDPLEIKVHVETTSSGWHFSIKDNGIGIDPQYSQKIFVMFQRLHGSREEGNGVGLALCKKIVENHQGRIWVESVLGQGSNFCFVIPQKEGTAGLYA